MRKIIKKYVPDLFVDFIRIRQRSKHIVNKSTKDIFTSYKETKFWKSTESLSGDGSELSVTIDLRKGLKRIIEQFEIKTILDIPCGDFNWMKAVDLEKIQYMGGDIVTSLIDNNSENYASQNIIFKELDLTFDELPNVDLIFCRDCLVHLSYKQICKAIKNIKRSNSTYLLATSFVKATKNKDILTGEWRKLNLEIAPFNFGKAIATIDEKYTEKGDRYADKSMCLWRIEDIKLPLKLQIYSWFI